MSWDCFFIPSIKTAILPDTMGAAILVPPNKENDSSLESFSNFKIFDGVNPYAPILIKSGFGSPITPGPLLEKSTTSL